MGMAEASGAPLPPPADPATITGSPEDVASRLLEGGNRAIHDVIAAIRRKDLPARDREGRAASAFIEELMVRLDHEGGGELVQNLSRVYEWWLHELLEGGRRGDVSRLERIGGQMEAMREAWAQRARQGVPGPLPGRDVDGEA